jgi:FlaG/FlaF family flagellin (archaellin)
MSRAMRHAGRQFGAKESQMSDLVFPIIGLVVFIALVVALAGPIRSYFSEESKVFLHDIKADDELDLEEAQREATAETRTGAKPG